MYEFPKCTFVSAYFPGLTDVPSYTLNGWGYVSMLEIHHGEKMLRLVEDSTIIPNCSLKGKVIFTSLDGVCDQSQRPGNTLWKLHYAFFFP